MKLSPKVGAALRRAVGTATAVLTDPELFAVASVVEILEAQLGLLGMVLPDADVKVTAAVADVIVDALTSERTARVRASIDEGDAT